MKIFTTSRPVTSLITTYNDFGFRLFAQLAQPDAHQNIFISPFSIAVALTMTLNGAAHETQKAMADTLGLNRLSLAEANAEAATLLTTLAQPDAEVQLVIANSLWTKADLAFKPHFIERNQNFYHAAVRAIDFTAPDAAATINAWVKDQTRDKIDRLVQPADLDALTSLILINALYFKGKWAQPFEAELTQTLPFALLDGSTKQQPFMWQTGEYRYYENELLQAVRLPYGAGRVSLYVVLPKPKNTLADLQAELTQQNWLRWLTKFKSQDGTILLPRFKLAYGQELKSALTALGMGLAFSQAKADFSQISDMPSYIAKVIHKTFVEVNETGTEAAAATAVTMWPRGGPPKRRFTLRVDRPFFCAIVDEQTSAILFMGLIVDPQAG